MHRLRISLFILLWATGSGVLFSADPATKGDSVWEIESLEPGDLIIILNRERSY